MKTILNAKAAVLGVALALTGIFAPTAPALADAKWCAVAGGRGGYENCGYYTFRQCLAAVRGVGGTCQLNPRWGAYEDEPVRVYRRVYYYVY